jgi:hypothetical protein
MAEQSPSTRTLSRSRGATSGILLVLLGAWGALAPFVGPYFNFTYTPDTAWHWTAARGWFQVLPGAVAFVAGLLLLFGRGRAVTLLGAWLGILAGAWFVIGPPLSAELTLGNLGVPLGTSSGQRAAETLGLFTGLGAVILFLAAAAFGRLSVVTVRDLRLAERREAERAEAEEAANREQAERQQAERQQAEQQQAERDRWDPAERDRAWHEGQAQGFYDQRSDPTYAGGDQPAQTQQLPPQQQGYQAAPVYRDQPSHHDSPAYGRHDAGVRGPADPDTQTAGDDTTADPRERR